MKLLAAPFALAIFLAALALAAPARAAAAECESLAACYGVGSAEASLSTTQAGAHPDLTLNFEMKQDPESKQNPSGWRSPYAATRDVRAATPPGLLANPNLLGLSQQCTVEAAVARSCPNGSQVGVGTVNLYNGNGLSYCAPLFMMVPPGGDVVARMVFTPANIPFFLDFGVRSEGDYGLTATLSGALDNVQLTRSETTIWGVPADPSHDAERGRSGVLGEGGCESAPKPPGSRPLPFLINPTSCGPGKEVTVEADSWLAPGLFSKASTFLPPISGCDKVPFGPALQVVPTSGRAESPSGVDLTLTLPEADGVNVLATAHLRDARIEMPPGLTVAPGSADGLEACSAAEVRLGKREDAHCPEAAKLGLAEFDIPALARRLKGAVYLRTPEPGHLVRIWLVADDLGAHVKLPGEITLDPTTGQLTALVLEAPQAPLREAKFFFKSGSHAALATPRACGTYKSHWTFTPWSGTPPVSGDSPMTVSEGCDTGGFAPQLVAGTANPQAGSYSPFVFDLIREDGEGNPSALDITLPLGLVAKLAGIPPCEGAAAETGNCPEASRIGRVLTAVGPGPAPLWAPQPGKDPLLVYLGGPYKGAPLSIVVKAPAQAGPFDLGVIVVRSAIYVDPETAKVTVRSDPLPQIIQGIPLDYRQIVVDMERPGFTLNPTSCEAMAIGARVTSAEGAVAGPSSRFQVGGCRGLGFKPSLSLKLKGGTRRGALPALRAVLRARPGDANIAGAQVALPHSEFLEQGHLNNICTRVQFKADECPAASIYGHAVAKTPLFDQPLEGPVYLRSSSHNLPDLVAALKGPASLPVEVDLDGRVDSVNGGIRTSFEVVPDAPVSEFTLSMQGGRKGLLVNSTDICAKTYRADARFTAQNGRAITLHPALQSSCAKRAARHKPSKHHRRG